MTAAGYPQFYVANEQVARESGHSDARIQCMDCHSGDNRTRDAKTAHKGMLKLLLIDHDGNPIDRKELLPQLIPSGTDRLNSLLPKIKIDGRLTVDPRVRNLLYHDHSPQSYGYDPQIAKKTCGKCHPKKAKQFNHATMGTNFKQRSSTLWTGLHGPSNCGPSFADTPARPEVERDGFSFGNTQAIAQNLNLPFANEQAMNKQKLCNICHAGCLDCHYAPNERAGVHRFVRKPTAVTCMGGGRGSSMCHTGASAMRRGDSYLGGEFSMPRGLPEDIHVGQKMACIDCHRKGPEGMGDLQRQGDCSCCHPEIEEALTTSPHKRVSCPACHIQRLGGYQLTTWGPGEVGGLDNPFKKYAYYYGTFEPPLLIRDQRGIWIPVKVWPNGVGNLKNPVSPQVGLIFRWPRGETRDAYALLGTFGGLPRNDLHLAWLQVDQVSHPLGKSRRCQSCHPSPQQQALSRWEFYDAQGARPFQGSHRILADAQGLRLTSLRVNSGIELLPGYHLADFASWYYLRDIWKIAGDFSLPPPDPSRYRLLSVGIAQGLDRLREIGSLLERQGKIRSYLPLWKRAKAAMAHNPSMAQELMGRIEGCAQIRDGEGFH